MNKKKIFKVIPLAALGVLVLTSCNLEVFADGDSLMTALNYGEQTRIIYSNDTPYYTPSGRKVSKGDYKPVWRHIQNELNVTLKEHQGAANSGEKKSVAYFRDNWLNKPYADVTMGTVDAITKYSMQGKKETILDLKPYMFKKDKSTDKYIKEYNPTTGAYEFVIRDDTVLPNLAKFMKENPGVLNSITTAKHSRPDQSAVYYVPYFDGFNDFDKLTMVRADYIQKIFDEFYEVDGEGTRRKKDTKYFPDTSFLGKDGKYKICYEPFDVDDQHKTPQHTITIPNKDGTGTQEITKTITENIIYLQNRLFNGEDPEYSDGPTTENLVKQFKKYIDTRYQTLGSISLFKGRYSDLFLGYDACYDPDELVALMRIIKTAPKTLFGENSKKEMVPWFPTECTNQRSADLYRWAGQMFGIRGLESRTGYLYLNGIHNVGQKSVDTVHDCRGDTDIVVMCDRLNKLYKEGLLLQDFDDTHATGTSDGKFARELIINDGAASTDLAGFMEYAFFQSEGSLNDDKDWKSDTEEEKQVQRNCDFRPIVGPFSKWTTNDNPDYSEKVYMQFTESWASIKTSAVCLGAALEKTPKKLNAALRFIDYIYSPKGRAAYNFGPSEDGYFYPGTFDADGNFTADDKLEEHRQFYQGKFIPKFTEKALEQNKQLDNYLRRYAGATIPMGYEKLNGMSYQLTSKKTQKGIDIVNKAVQLKTFKHVCIRDVLDEYPELKGEQHKEELAFYKIVPSTFVLTSGQNTAIANILDKNKLGSIFTDDSKSRFNIWDGYVMGNKMAYAPELKDYLDTVQKWDIDKLVTYYQDAYEYAVL